MNSHPIIATETVNPLDVAKLDRRQHRQYLETLDRIAEINSGVRRSSAGRIVRPADSERKLVLFTLGILVGLLVIGAITLAILRREAGAVGPVVTLAGTGLGFIGGMVQKDRDQPAGQSQQKHPNAAAGSPQPAAVVVPPVDPPPNAP